MSAPCARRSPALQRSSAVPLGTGFLRDVTEKSSALSLDIAGDFLVGGFALERERLRKLAGASEKEDEEEEEETSENEEDKPNKKASFADVLYKLARNIVLPTTLAAMIAAKARDGANAVEETRNVAS